MRLELAELAQGIVGQPAWEGHSFAREFYERRAAELESGARRAIFLGAGSAYRAWEREVVEVA